MAENPEKGSRSVRKIALLESFQVGAEVRRMCHWWTLMTWARVVAMVWKSFAAKKRGAPIRAGEPAGLAIADEGCRRVVVPGGGRLK